MRRGVEDITDYSKPFTLKVVEIKETLFGKVKYIPVFARQYRYPEPMMVDAQILRDEGYLVWTYGPDPELWADDRVPAPDKSFTFEDALPPEKEFDNTPMYPNGVDHDGDVIPF